MTLQSRPAIKDRNPAVPQSGYSGGMLVGLLNGSVRFVSQDMSPSTFWSAVTPSGGGVLGSDW
jgi:hypothetical protein